MPQQPGFDKKIRVVGCRPIYTGRNQQSGSTYTIYEIEAERPEDGHRINEKVRAFQPLPVGEVIEVTISPFDSERHGRSYTLHPKEKPVGATGSTQQRNDLAEQLEQVREVCRKLHTRLAEVETRLAELMRDEHRQQSAPTTAPNAQLDAAFGAEAPW